MFEHPTRIELVTMPYQGIIFPTILWVRTQPLILRGLILFLYPRRDSNPQSASLEGTYVNSVTPLGHIMITVVGFFQVPLSAIFSRAQPCGIDYVHAVIICVGVAGWIRTNGFLHVKQMYLPTIRQPH